MGELSLELLNRTAAKMDEERQRALFGSPGTIAYLCREDAAPPMFGIMLAQLAQRHPNAKVVCILTNNVAEGRNHAALEMQGDWLFFIDTDQQFAPDIIHKLLAREVDIVQALCLMRHFPHAPLLYSQDDTNRDKRVVGPPGLVPVKVLGAGGTLYKRAVFEAIEPPWFEGIIGTEDICLAKKAVAKGFKLFVDTAVVVGHNAPMTVWPHYQDGVWYTGYTSVSGHSILLPPVEDSNG